MNNNAGYQPAGQTVVVVSSTRPRGPQFLQQGVRVGGLMVGLSCVVCLGVFGGFFLLSATIMLATANYDDDFWDQFDRDTDPTVIVGSIFLTIGILLVVACVGVLIFARRKYKNFQGDRVTNPGRVINPPPGGPNEQPLTGGYPGQPQSAAYPGQPQPTAYGQPQPTAYGQPHPAGFEHPQPYVYPGQPQPAGYPAQPQPAGYPAQPPTYPEPTSSYPGPPAPYAQPPGGYAPQPNPPYPEKMSVTNVTSEYAQPPPTAPETSSEPPPYQP